MVELGLYANDTQRKIFFEQGNDPTRGTEFSSWLYILGICAKVIQTNSKNDLTELNTLLGLINIRLLEPTAWAHAYCKPVKTVEGDWSEHPAVLQMVEEIQRVRQDGLFNALQALNNLKLSHACSSPNCNATFAEELHKFSECARCARATYCSVRCQRNAWRHPSLPHRAVCSSIRFFVAHLQLPRSCQTLKFEPFLTAHSTAPSTAQAQAVVAAKVIVKHMYALHLTKMSSPSTSSSLPCCHSFI